MILPSWPSTFPFPTTTISLPIHAPLSSILSLRIEASITDKEEIAAALKASEDYNDIDLLLSLLRIRNVDDGDGDNLTFVVEDLGLPLPSSITPGCLEIAGHCDGIICLNKNNVDVLCNPAIKEFKVLPESSVLYDLPPKAEYEDEYTAPWENTAAIGFGFDSKAKEYKVLRVVETTSGLCTYHPTRAEVYTMGADSWREVKNVDITDYRPSWAPSFTMHSKGVFYWWATSDLNNKELILTFDMSDEVFHQIPVPECFNFIKDGCYRSLTVLKESVVLLAYDSEDEVPKTFNIWMMDESTGVKGSWIKYMEFGPVEDVIMPLVFWNSEELLFLLMVNIDSRVVSYNPSTRKLHHFPIHGVENARYLQAVNYVHSIISVNGDGKHDNVSGMDNST